MSRMATFRFVALTLMAIPSHGNAHFYGPPGFTPLPELYEIVSDACGATLPPMEEDVSYGFGPNIGLLQSANRTQNIDGKTYYETFVIIDDKGFECAGVVFSLRHPNFGWFHKTKASKKADTIVLKTPYGKLEVSIDGAISLLGDQ